MSNLLKRQQCAFAGLLLAIIPLSTFQYKIGVDLGLVLNIVFRLIKVKSFYISWSKKPISGPRETNFCPLYTKLCFKSRGKICGSAFACCLDSLATLTRAFNCMQSQNQYFFPRLKNSYICKVTTNIRYRQ